MIKPPNILIYCYKNLDAFQTISRTLRSCLGQSRYTVYQLDESEPWQKHCALVVIASHSKDVPYKVVGQIKHYMLEGGKVLSMGGYFTNLLPLDCVHEPPGPCLDDLCSTPSCLTLGQGLPKKLIVIPSKSFNDQNILQSALAELDIYCKSGDSIKLQPLHVYCRDSYILKEYFLRLLQTCQKSDEGHPLFAMNEDDAVPIICEDLNKSEFFGNHNTGSFPEIFIHSKVVTSTQDLLWNNNFLRKEVSSVAILSDVQISGKGRGKNQWISPQGSMCLSFYLTLDQNCLMTKKLPFVQYITALAVTRAVSEIYGQDSLLKIKWPNDLYTTNGEKIGGVLVNCSSNGKETGLCIGIGINVNNDEPTISLAKLFGPKISVQKLAAKVCSLFMEEINLFNEKGCEQFVERFCQVWLQTGKKVRINVGAMNCDAVIKSIDPDGYLSVFNLSTQKNVSVQPDGNSFDMMENLIAVKTA